MPEGQDSSVGRKMPEVQTTIDEAGDGTWEGTLYIGSNFICRLHGDILLDAAKQLDERITTEASRWGRG